MKQKRNIKKSNNREKQKGNVVEEVKEEEQTFL
jgi:hypothetical protein